jgi:hypothetical protein
VRKKGLFEKKCAKKGFLRKSAVEDLFALLTNRALAALLTRRARATLAAEG